MFQDLQQFSRWVSYLIGSAIVILLPITAEAQLAHVMGTRYASASISLRTLERPGDRRQSDRLKPHYSIRVEEPVADRPSSRAAPE